MRGFPAMFTKVERTRAHAPVYAASTSSGRRAPRFYKHPHLASSHPHRGQAPSGYSSLRSGRGDPRTPCCHGCFGGNPKPPSCSTLTTCCGVMMITARTKGIKLRDAHTTPLLHPTTWTEFSPQGISGREMRDKLTTPLLLQIYSGFHTPSYRSIN